MIPSEWNEKFPFPLFSLLLIQQSFQSKRQSYQWINTWILVCLMKWIKVYSMQWFVIIVWLSYSFRKQNKSNFFLLPSFIFIFFHHYHLETHQMKLILYIWSLSIGRLIYSLYCIKKMMTFKYVKISNWNLI